MNRRKFLRQASQYTIAAGISAMAGYLIFREKPDEVCQMDFACKNCSKSKQCQLPESPNKNNKNNNR